MPCIVFSLIQLLVPNASAMAADLQVRALVLSGFIFAFVARRGRCGPSRFAKAR